MIDINRSNSLPPTDEIALAEEKGMTLAAFRSSSGQTKSWEEYYQSLLVDPADYWKQHFSGRTLFRYLQSHPDMDHMSGLYRLFYQDRVSLENFWDVNNSKVKLKQEFENSPYDWNDWAVYNRLKTGYVQDSDEHSKPITVLHKTLGAEGQYWTDDGITILSPTTDLTAYCDKTENWNNASYILALTYGGRRVILPGDAEKPAWDSVESNHPTEALSCDILKAAHHGRKSGYSQSAVEVMSPDVVICSVGKKPDVDAYDDYKGHNADVLSTRYNGTITCQIWADGEVSINNSKGDRVASLPILAR
jgi:beta-lactamase superfamily II metal-dependent hydrolase